MMNLDEWDERSCNMYIYKNEIFYTVTPIPYYYERRKVILGLLNHLIKPSMRVLDIGCGTGEYIDKLQRKDVGFHGVDISEGMICRAKERVMQRNVTFEVSANGTEEREFDFAMCIHVLAHIDDATAKMLIANAYQSLKPKGRLVICEQVYSYRKSGRGWTRRTMSEYKKMFEEVGFEVEMEKSVRIHFGFDRLVFEKCLSRLFRYVWENKSNEVNIYCNKKAIYRLISWICTKLSFKRCYTNLAGDGYLFLCGQKK